MIIATLCSFSLCDSSWAQQTAPKKRPNVLIIVADDMNWDTPGCFGGAAPDITPNIDRLATEGMRFRHAYVNISICTPSRSVILTGLYPRNNGAEGFQRIRPGTPNLPLILNAAGYLCGIIGKPLRQQELFRWSTTYRWQGTGDENRWGRDPAVFRKFAKNFFAMANTSQQPFFLMANSHDPHRPFGGGKATRPLDERAASSRIFKPEEVRLPPVLPDLPGVRKEFADYCTSVRRLDDMVGAVLDELASAKRVEDTIVIFLADHGMPFPGAKFNCYPDSLRTPLIIRWPGPSRMEPSTRRTWSPRWTCSQPFLMPSGCHQPRYPTVARSCQSFAVGSRRNEMSYSGSSIISTAAMHCLRTLSSHDSPLMFSTPGPTVSAGSLD